MVSIQEGRGNVHDMWREVAVLIAIAMVVAAAIGGKTDLAGLALWM